jgi:hypothetical protein
MFDFRRYGCPWLVSALAMLMAACGIDCGRPVDFWCEYQGTVYNCSALDRCTETSLQYRLACCECDVALCNVDPSCPADEPIAHPESSSCMACHNGSDREDYGGTGLSNPHPFRGAAYLSCVQCHGGEGAGLGKWESHVPAPPRIGDRLQQQNEPYAYFNRVTLTGIDKIEPYTGPDGREHTGLDYLQFVNPGDLRVVAEGRSCGTAGCHGGEHVDWVKRSPMATGAGIYGAALQGAGLPNASIEYRGWYVDTAADYGFRQVSDPGFVYTGDEIGRVGALAELSEKARYGQADGIHNNPLHNAALLDDYIYTESVDGQYANQIIPDSPLHDLYQDSVAIACGGCHLGSAGANRGFADFRSSGCTACHMPYNLDGRSRSLDPNVSKREPADPDVLAPGERPHPDAHQLRSVAKILDRGAVMRGIDDRACVGCHQGSNNTVMQFWGIRPDDAKRVNNNSQYPANPVSFVNTVQNTTLFSPIEGNVTFNGRDFNQLLEFEDHDGDNRDDTPKDIHHERGLSCIDCHGSRDVHNGARGDASSGKLWSRQDQALAIACESCHGGIAAYAATVPCVDYDGAAAECAADRYGNALRNVTVNSEGEYWLRGRIDGRPHYVPQTRDVVVQSNKIHPLTRQALYRPIASYAMGRADGDARTGIGPRQADPGLYTPGFSHSDTMDCVSCHAAWTNSCIGCHMASAYDASRDNFYFSNTTGERIVLRGSTAAPVYSTPLLFLLSVGSKNRITQTAPGVGLFFRYEADLNGRESRVLAFSDRNGQGNNPGDQGRGALGALGHGKMMPHSIRGRVDINNEGPRYCVSCHLNSDQIAVHGAAYTQFYSDMQNGNFGGLDFALLQEHIGQNPGNQLDSPYWVHMAAGLGTGLFLFDINGCPVNPLDPDASTVGCQGSAPAELYDPANAVYQLDRVVENTGVANASSSHPLGRGAPSVLRAGALYPGLAGPLGGPLIQKLADPNAGLILDSWINADALPRGSVLDFLR